MACYRVTFTVISLHSFSKGQVKIGDQPKTVWNAGSEIGKKTDFTDFPSLCYMTTIELDFFSVSSALPVL